MKELTPCEREAWRRFLTAQARVAEEVEKALADAGQPAIGDIEVLVVLRRAEDRKMRMSELAKHVALSRSGLTRQVDRLEKLGYIKRASCPKDRRGTYAVLLPKGLEAAEQATPIYARAIREKFLEPMGKKLEGLAMALEGLLESKGPCF